MQRLIIGHTPHGLGQRLHGSGGLASNVWVLCTLTHGLGASNKTALSRAVSQHGGTTGPCRQRLPLLLHVVILLLVLLYCRASKLEIRGFEKKKKKLAVRDVAIFIILLGSVTRSVRDSTERIRPAGPVHGRLRHEHRQRLQIERSHTIRKTTTVLNHIQY